MSSGVKSKRVAIIAGELSGDHLGAGLIEAVHSLDPSITFEGVAGPGMQKQGCTALFNASELAVMGLTEVLKDLPRLLKIKKQLIEHWANNPPDLFIGIDAPDFSLRVAAKLRTHGVRTIQYVCPSVWAWRSGRVKKIEKAVDELFCLLPFEPDYFANTTVSAHYVGHPLADSLGAAERSITQNQEFQIALLPGSRLGEIERMLPAFVATAHRLQRRYPKASFHIPAATAEVKNRIDVYLSTNSGNLDISVQLGGAELILAQSDVALLASGTVALEAMLLGCPMVVAYKLAPSTYRFLKWTKAFKSKYISLPNIIADRPLVPEIVQEGVEPDRLSRALIYWLDNPKARQSLLGEFKELHEQLKQGTNKRVAELVLSALRRKEVQA